LQSSCNLIQKNNCTVILPTIDSDFLSVASRGGATRLVLLHRHSALPNYSIALSINTTPLPLERSNVLIHCGNTSNTSTTLLLSRNDESSSVSRVLSSNKLRPIQVNFEQSPNNSHYWKERTVGMVDSCVVLVSCFKTRVDLDENQKRPFRIDSQLRPAFPRAFGGENPAILHRLAIPTLNTTGSGRKLRCKINGGIDSRWLIFPGDLGPQSFVFRARQRILRSSCLLCFTL
jgi:hypothetical protein